MPGETRPEIDQLEDAAAWRLRLVDAHPDDKISAAAASRLQKLADDLRSGAYVELWTELQAISNWLAESDAISDFASLAADYRTRIGVSDCPEDGAAYLKGLLDIARSLV